MASEFILIASLRRCPKSFAQQQLNRILAYCHQRQVSKSRRDRLRKTMEILYDRCSAGTHADVSVHEARLVFLQTYVALGELLTLEEPTPTEA
ncbi:hypothetical protein ACWDUL_38950 [Nocardia niigatensis]|uniref:hypothetical protein n=1 Tax=Nocardia niigatensis TaxID=209249 RepID=UPI00030231A8|nr:hypothetical protein [Nocardia niigatensis]